MSDADVDVLVVGGGPVGLSLAIELGSRGVRVLLAERNARGGQAPRAKTTNVRTRTHLRRWGIADRLAEASPLGITYPNDIMFVTRLADHKLAVIPDAFNAAPAPSPHYPEHAQWVPQYTLERILLEHARTLPSVEIRFGTSFVTAAEDAEGVTCTLEEKGEQQRVTARYLVGADGARSGVRTLIGARMQGRFLARNYNIVFHAPGIAQAHPHGPAIMYWQVNSDGASLMGPMDRGDVWFFMPTGLKEGEVLSDAQAIERIRRATNLDLPYEILSSDEWNASELLADHYRRGRIFLAGDAAHLHPPFGGYGMNMGVGDGVDLGWKLAAVLQGWGGEALLDSYEAERRPVHDAVIQEAVANYGVQGGQLYRPGIEDDTPEGKAIRREVGERVLALKPREFRTLGAVLGLGYEGSPVITPDGTPPEPFDGQVYRASARPGSLAPHAWLPDGRALYDLFGQGFTLVVAEGADPAQVAAAERDARERGAPLAVVRPPGLDVRGLYGADLTLVRPDQMVAWRGAKWDAAVLGHAVGADPLSLAA